MSIEHRSAVGRTRSAWFALVVWILCGVAWGAPQAQPQVNARLETGVLKLGERTRLVVTLEGAASGELVELPEVPGLRFVGVQGPSVQTYTAIINGRRTVEQSLTWAVLVEGLEEGDFEVPGVVVETGGRRLSTAPQPLTVQADLLGEELGFIELRGLTERAVEGLPIEVELRFGWDRAISSETNYANLSLPWWDNVDGALLEALDVRGARRAVDVQLNRRQLLTVGEVDDTERDGRVFRTFSISIELVPTRSGTLSLPTSFLQFGTARSNFFGQESLLRSYFARAPAVELRAEPLPEDGQPTDFGRAVGTFDVRATADTRDVVAGDSIKLTVEWTGRGNFDYFEPPDPSRQPGYEGFRYFGLTEEKLPGRRRVTYDLAPLDERVTELPALELPYFDVERWEYRRLGTRPIPIRVRPLEGEGALSERERFAEDLRDIRTAVVAPGGARSSAPSLEALLGASAGILLGWAALRTVVRAGGRDPASELERRRRRALRRFERELRTSLDPETDLRAFAGFVAARAGEETEAWIGRDVREAFGPRSSRALPPDSLELLERTQRELEAAVFGDGERVARAELSQVAKDLLEEGL
jgi:hypothetical protein